MTILLHVWLCTKFQFWSVSAWSAFLGVFGPTLLYFILWANENVSEAGPNQDPLCLANLGLRKAQESWEGQAVRKNAWPARHDSAGTRGVCPALQTELSPSSWAMWRKVAWCLETASAYYYVRGVWYWGKPKIREKVIKVHGCQGMEVGDEEVEGRGILRQWWYPAQCCSDGPLSSHTCQNSWNTQYYE